MSSPFSKFGYWLVRKLLMAAVVAVVGFITYGLWLFERDADGYENNQAALVGQREHFQSEEAALKTQTAELDARIASQEQRVVMAGQVIKTLKGMDSTWDRLIWNRAQQRAYDEQSARMQVVRKTAEADLVRLRHDRIKMNRAYEHAAAESARAERAVTDHGKEIPVWRHYLQEAWAQGRWYAGLVVAAYLLGPTLVFLKFYYVLAPFVVRGRPMRLTETQTMVSTASTGMTSVENAVWPGETLLVAKKFVESTDADLMKRTRAVMSWRFPFACLSGGLFNMCELRNGRNAGGKKVTLAGKGRTGSSPDFAVIEVPENGSMVVRPGFIAGVLIPAEARLVIRRHWRFFCWQSWMAGQFRFFEFEGPCRLILVKRGALRVEQLEERAGVPTPVARVRQMAVVAFTPNLECRPVRAVSFWRYYTGATKLFEAGFSGPGLVVHATRAGGGEGSTGLRRRVLKVFGI
ncbi:MAG TPA: hypothetical protein VL357_00955 [Rariglobus sp.]|jgi:hypothetical protein|nr:hypothetical protein [Rariglobus sp.]